MDIKAKFDHFNFNVTDLERSISFYNKALGFVESHRINSKDGSFIIVYLKDNQSDFLLELTWMRDHPQAYDLGECEFHLCVRVPGDYDAVRAFHKEMGVVVMRTTTWDYISSKTPTDIGLKYCRKNRVERITRIYSAPRNIQIRHHATSRQ